MPTSSGSCRCALTALLICSNAVVALPAARATSPLRVVPTAWRVAAQPIEAVEVVALPQLDRNWLALDDQLRDQEGLPARFAVPNEVAVSPDLQGTWELVDESTWLWRYRIQAPGASSLNLGFSRFVMPPGGQLLLYPSSSRGELVRPFTAADNDDHGELWTPPVRTDDLIVEVTLPFSARADLELVIGSINQGYRGFGAEAVLSGSCNLDVECLEPADPWREEMQAVAVISTGGSTFCTGSLINNTANDHRMYFMTANHCGIGSGNAASLVTFWNYQNSFCRTPGSAQSGQAGDGTFDEFHTGSIFRAGGSATDFTLVELDDPPVVAFNHFWAGWDRSPGDFTCTPAAPCACIHHPNTDEKRITYVTTNTATTSYFGTTSPGDGSHVWSHWATDPPGPFTVPGVTEPGSSGSPLYTAEGRFIGQLHGGPSACGETGDDLSDYYGRFSVSWTGGGTNSTRLSNWLDPLATGAMTHDGIANCTAPGIPTIGTATAVAPNQVQLTWADGAPSATTFDVYRAFGTCASPGPFAVVAAGVAGSPFLDTTVSGGSTYAYQVTGRDATGGCESAPSACVQATATGACTLPPSFAGLTSVTNQAASTCGLTLAWSAATASCGGPLTYNVYRSTTAGFDPGPGNQIAMGVTGTGYVDAGSLTSGTIYHYVVRAIDAANSVEDANEIEQSGVPTGPITSTTLTETFEGPGGFDHPGWSHSALNGTVDWTWSTAQAHTPTHSWFSASQTAVSSRALVTPSFVPSATSALSFRHTFAFESTTTCYDGGTLEVSTNGGSTWAVVPDAAFTAGGFNGTVGISHSNPIGGKRAWCHGTIGVMTEVTVELDGFMPATDVKLRWHEGNDSSVASTGWFVDSVTLTDVGAAGVCSALPALLSDGFESGTLVPPWSSVTP